MKLEIIFTPTLGVSYDFLPSPSQFVLPDWYKKTSSYIKDLEIEVNGEQTNATIKKCMPVFDALTTGYIIPTPCDVEVRLEDNKSVFYSEWYVGWHNSIQATEHPTPHKSYLPKFINPWSIETSKGTSCLFLQPFHRELPFQILEGVVDTDTYTVPVNFPFTLKDKNWEGVIPAGTPMVQVIPFVRKEWVMRFGGIENYNEMKEKETLLKTLTMDRYKKLFRQKKSYK